MDLDINKFAEILQNIGSEDEKLRTESQEQTTEIMNSYTQIGLDLASQIILNQTLSEQAVAQALNFIGLCLRIPGVNISIIKGRWARLPIPLQQQIIDSCFKALTFPDSSSSNLAARNIGLISYYQGSIESTFIQLVNMLDEEGIELQTVVSIMNGFLEVFRIAEQRKLNLRFQSFYEILGKICQVLCQLLVNQDIPEYELLNLLETLQYILSQTPEPDESFTQQIMEILSNTFSSHKTTQIAYSIYITAFELYQQTFQNLPSFFQYFLPIIHLGFEDYDCTTPSLEFISNMINYYYRNFVLPNLTSEKLNDEGQDEQFNFSSALFSDINDILIQTIQSRTDFETIPNDFETPISSVVEVYKNFCMVDPDNMIEFIMTFFIENISNANPNIRYGALVLAEVVTAAPTQKFVEAYSTIITQIIANINDQPLTIILKSLNVLEEILQDNYHVSSDKEISEIIVGFINDILQNSSTHEIYAFTLKIIQALIKVWHNDSVKFKYFSIFQETIFQIAELDGITSSPLVVTVYETLGLLVEFSPNPQFLSDVTNFILASIQELMSSLNDDTYENNCKLVGGLLYVTKKLANRITEDMKYANRITEDMKNQLYPLAELVGNVLDQRVPDIFDDAQNAMRALICSLGLRSKDYFDKIMPSIIFGLQNGIEQTFLQSAMTIKQLTENLGTEFDEGAAAVFPILFDVITEDAPLAVFGTGLTALGYMFKYNSEPAKEFMEPMKNILIFAAKKPINIDNREEEEVQAAIEFYIGIIEAFRCFVDFVQKLESDEGVDMIVNEISRPLFISCLGKMPKVINITETIAFKVVLMLESMVDCSFRNQISKFFHRDVVGKIFDICKQSQNVSIRKRTESVIIKCRNA